MSLKAACFTIFMFYNVSSFCIFFVERTFSSMCMREKGKQQKDNGCLIFGSHCLNSASNTFSMTVSLYCQLLVRNPAQTGCPAIHNAKSQVNTLRDMATSGWLPFCRAPITKKSQFSDMLFFLFMTAWTTRSPLILLFFSIMTRLLIKSDI